MVKKLDAIKIYEIAESGNAGARFFLNIVEDCETFNDEKGTHQSSS